MLFLAEMGSDLSINTIAVNFLVNAELNKDVAEANNLNMRIFERLSITPINDDIHTRPLILLQHNLRN
jgi:hypothetical protein